MNPYTPSQRAGGVLALAQLILPASIGLALPTWPRRRRQSPPAKPCAQPRDAAWYDDFYRRAIASSGSDTQPVRGSLKVLGPWYYFMIPELRAVLKRTDKLLELGCGQGQLLRYLAAEKIVDQKNIHGLDQSRTAAECVKALLPEANITTGDIYRLEHASDSFPAC